MVCDKCNQRDSIIRVSIITKGEKTSLNLCNECLKHLVFNSSAINNVSTVYIEVIINLISEYLSDIVNDENFELDIDKDNETEQYSMDDSLDELQNRLDMAVKDENYEYAVILRDRIIALKKGDQ